MSLLIEHGSMPDQRLVAMFEDVEGASTNLGETTEGDLIGWAICWRLREGVLEDIEVDLEGQEHDRQHITKWLGGKKSDVWKGFSVGWADN